VVRVLTTGPITGGSETILLAEDAGVIDVQLFVHLSGRPAGGGVRPKHLEALMRFKLLVVAVVFGTGLMAGRWAQAQAPAQTPTVISGSDLGFRVDQHKGNTPVGTLVVRVNGQWVEAEFSVGIKRITK
jgi:hypothetical protein